MFYYFSQFRRFEKLVHVVTSAHHESTKYFNISDHTGEGAENALCNRKTVCDSVGLNLACLTTGQQVHKTNVFHVKPEDVGRGSDGWSTAIPETDALITNLIDTPLMVISADCPLILLYDSDRPAIGVIHASWRCTFGGIIGKTVRMMGECFGTNPARIYAGIGPGAGPCCYEIDDAFIQTISSRPELLPYVVEDDTYDDKNGKNEKNVRKHFDLFSAGRGELVRAGLPGSQIEVMGICTICNENFFSFRRQGAAAGRFALMAAIKK
jgi:YfiH family protein